MLAAPTWVGEVGIYMASTISSAAVLALAYKTPPIRYVIDAVRLRHRRERQQEISEVVSSVVHDHFIANESVLQDIVDELVSVTVAPMHREILSELRTAEGTTLAEEIAAIAHKTDHLEGDVVELIGRVGRVEERVSDLDGLDP